MVDLVAARALFPVTRRYAYLNHAAHSPISTRVAAAMQDYIDELQVTGIISLDPWNAKIGVARQSAARLIGATPAEVAFVKNTSAGLLLVANGLDWRTGDNIVTVETEFPSNVHPWLNLRRLGVETRFAPRREGRVHLDDIAALMDRRTRLVAISFVNYNTGFRYDLAQLAEIVHARGALLVVDSVQGLGAMTLDVRAMDIDFMSAGGHKWLMGPYGAGIFYIKRELVDCLTPIWTSWMSMADAWALDNYDQPLAPDARRFEEATAVMASILGLGASIDTLLEFGVANIQDQLLSLAAAFMAELEARGYHVHTPRACDDERSGIVVFQHPTRPSAEIEATLRAADIIVSIRNGALRASPHFYNSWDDLARLLAEMP